MKRFLLIPLSFFMLQASAQNEKAFIMPSFTGTAKLGWKIPVPAVTPDGKKLIVGSSLIDPYNKQQSQINPPNQPEGSFTAVIYSPGYTYSVTNQVGTKYSPVTNEKNKTKDWLSAGFSNTDPAWQYKSYEDNYAVGVTDAGEVIVTIPSGFTTKGFLSIEKMKGIWRYNPKTGIKTLITDDVLYDDSYFTGTVAVTQDRKKLIVHRQQKHVPAEMVVYDLATGSRHSFKVETYYKIVAAGNDIVLLQNDMETGTKKEISLLSLDDGHPLLNTEQNLTSGSQYGGLPNCFISGNSFYFLHPTDLSVAKMEMDNGQMSIRSITKLDTAGLKLALYSTGTNITYETKDGKSTRTETKIDGTSRYCLAVMKDYYVIFPGYIPQGYVNAPYPLFMYFMHPASGEALLAMKPYFEQPVVRDYAAEKAKEEETQRLNQEACNAKLATSPFPMGALLSKKGDHCKAPAFIWGGVNCSTLKFQAFGITGALRGYEIILHPTDFEVCDAGPYTICSYCRGAGKYKQWGTASDDGWKQTNFNVYVRDPNGVKAVQLDHYCDVCGGKGYYRSN